MSNPREFDNLAYVLRIQMLSRGHTGDTEAVAKAIDKLIQLRIKEALERVVPKPEPEPR